jgi:hypothetical protein
MQTKSMRVALQFRLDSVARSSAQRLANQRHPKDPLDLILGFVNGTPAAPVAEILDLLAREALRLLGECVPIADASHNEGLMPVDVSHLI